MTVPLTLQHLRRAAVIPLLQLVAVVAFAMSGGVSARADRAVNIGVLTDMVGLYKDLGGEGSVVAARMAIEDFGGQALGTVVQVYVGDHKHDVATALAIADNWFKHDDVGLVVDLPNSAVALAAQKLAYAKNRVTITVSGGSTDLTGSACTPTGFHWAYDTYANTVPLARGLVGFRSNSWYFITADYAFGLSLEKNTTAAVEESGGRVLGHSRHPLNAESFIAQLTAAQDSGARVIALANAGGDTIKAVKEAAEIGISARSQTLVPLLVYISDIHSLGLDVAKGMTFIDGFYWDADPAAQDWSKRFFARQGVMPTMTHAGVYSAVRHYLRAVQAAGTDDALVVSAKMRELRVDDFFAKGGHARADGRMIHDMYLVQIKQPHESRYPWDYYKILSTIPGDKAFRPLAEGNCTLVKK
jgi:branched-chain amino acid transport system substrate-binding protein